MKEIVDFMVELFYAIEASQLSGASGIIFGNDVFRLQNVRGVEKKRKWQEMGKKRVVFGYAHVAAKNS